MRKDALVSYVRTMILNSEAVADNQRVAHFQRVAQGVNYAFDTLLSQIGETRKGKSEIESYYVKHYYSQPVVQSGNYRYVGVSDDVVPVAGGNGIWYVQPSRDSLDSSRVGANFARTQRPTSTLINSLPVGESMNETFFRFGNVTGNKQIIFEDIGKSPFTDVRTVDYGIVRAFSSYDDDEEVFIPDGRADLLLQMVLTWFGDVEKTLPNDNV